MQELECNRNEATESRNEDPFTPVSTPQTLTTADLLGMDSPDAMVQTGIAMFAVAAREGVMTIADGAVEYEATMVLYLSSDGEHAMERQFRRGLASAPRACIAAEEQLVEAGPNARGRADVLAIHPEVEQ